LKDGRNRMLVIDKYSSKPIYEQIIEGTEKNILLGLMREGDAVPSVRELSVTLQINPNTIQKSYIELERRGSICSVQGRGSFVREGAVEAIKKRERQKLEELKETARSLKLAGVSQEELSDAIDEVFKEGNI